jgi:hypothetical protein
LTTSFSLSPLVLLTRSSQKKKKKKKKHCLHCKFNLGFILIVGMFTFTQQMLVEGTTTNRWDFNPHEIMCETCLRLSEQIPSISPANEGADGCMEHKKDWVDTMCEVMATQLKLENELVSLVGFDSYCVLKGRGVEGS